MRRGTTRSREHKYSLGLGELMLIIGSVAIVLGLVRLAPAVAMVAGVVILIALIRTLGALHRARGWKVPMSTWDVVSLIATSLGIGLLIVASSTVAFFVTCFPTGYAAAAIFYDSAFMFVGIFAGFGIGLVAAAWVARKIYNRHWMAGTPPRFLGIHYLDETPENTPPPAEPSATPPEPPQ